MGIKKEIGKRQLVKPGGHPVNTEIRPVFISLRLYILQRGGGGQETSLPWYKEQLK